MKKIYDRTLDEQINDRRKHEKANVVFNKLLAQQKAKKKDWSELRSYTLPITKEIKPGADDV